MFGFANYKSREAYDKAIELYNKDCEQGMDKLKNYVTKEIYMPQCLLETVCCRKWRI